MTEQIGTRPPEPGQLPRAQPPKGWRWKRRNRRERTFHDRYPAPGAKVRVVTATLLDAVALICVGLALLALLAAPFGDGAWWLMLFGTGVFLLIGAYIVRSAAEGVTPRVAKAARVIAGQSRRWRRNRRGSSQKRPDGEETAADRAP